jgi:ssDNA-binding Zn-finger/Zn-ribbon topoisomerase 1
MDTDKCPVCKAHLIERNGAFGAFLCCPNSTKKNNHGTWPVEDEGYEDPDWLDPNDFMAE